MSDTVAFPWARPVVVPVWVGEWGDGHVER